MFSFEKVPGGSPTSTIVFWVVTWFTLNLSITILNKSVFYFIDFPYPMLLTAVHMLCTGAGAHIILRVLRIKRKKQDRSGKKKLIAFSVLFTLNIIAGNTSLRFVSVSFNQVVRACVPSLTMALSFLFLGKAYSRQRILSIVPVVVGVIIAVYGDLTFTWFGLTLTIFAGTCAATKAVVSEKFLSGANKLNAFDLLAWMCPFAMAQALFASFFFGEISSLLAEEEPFDGQTWAVVWLTGLIACLLNIASFLVNVHTSALTLTIAGNVKQAVVIFLSCFIFATPMSPTNLLGITVVVCGGAFYSYVGHREKLLQKKNDYKRVPTTERPMSLCLAV